MVISSLFDLYVTEHFSNTHTTDTMQQNFKDWVIQNQFLTLKEAAKEMFLMVLRDAPAKVRDRIAKNITSWSIDAGFELKTPVTTQSTDADEILADLEERFKDELAKLPWAA